VTIAAAYLTITLTVALILPFYVERTEGWMCWAWPAILLWVVMVWTAYRLVDVADILAPVARAVGMAVEIVLQVLVECGWYLGDGLSRLWRLYCACVKRYESAVVNRPGNYVS
jgi:hypothetical protein